MRDESLFLYQQPNVTSDSFISLRFRCHPQLLANSGLHADRQLLFATFSVVLFLQNLLDAFAGRLGAENIERIEDAHTEGFTGYGDA